MTRERLLQLLTNYGITNQFSGHDELGVRCPNCVPLHDVQRRRFTLNINTTSWRWRCVRCEAAGRELATFWRLLRLPPLIEPDTPLVNDETFDHAATFDTPSVTAINKIALPPEYRHDWDATVTGRSVLRYLRRRLSTEAINISRVGYAVSGKLTGCAIFPVHQAHELMFWQARQVLLNGPKYLNPPDAPKSRALYGLDWLRGRRAVLVEGIFDALCTPDAVALFGKLISDSQIQLLQARGINDVEIRLDSDALVAAKNVAAQIASKLLTANGRATIAILPSGADPATSASIIDRITLQF
jgi:hypothetical protein